MQQQNPSKSSHRLQSAFPRRSTARGVAIATVGALGVAGVVFGSGLAGAAVPSFPDNVVVFPDRDFITIEGYQDHIGETGLVEVKRAGKVIGSARGVVEPGDVAFEINHPGGYCWGAGTTLKVTPDIRAGDVATVTFPNGETGDTTVGDAAVTSDAQLAGNVLTVTGRIGPNVNPAQMEQRIINPDLVDTDVARRDIRAVSGPLARAAKGGYSSSLTFDGETFTAIYQFDDAATATIASKASLGERAMSWQVEDADGNRQGLTIAEYGEAGGPGMGGCPAGPAAQAPPAGSFGTVRSADKKSIAVTWIPAEPVPGGDAVTGYAVEAIAPASGGVSTTYGARTNGAATRATLTVDPAVASYTVEVRAMTTAAAPASVPRLGDPFTAQPPTPPTPPANPDQIAPKLTATPAPSAELGGVIFTNKVTLLSEAEADIYYTTNGDAAVTGDLPGDTAKLYTGQIDITGIGTELKAVAFDAAGNIDTFVGLYSPAAAQTPLAAPASLTGTAVPAGAKLTWSAVAGASAYQLAVVPAPAAGQPAPTGDLTQTVEGLNPGTKYTFTVTASDSIRTSAASPSATVTPAAVLARVVISTGKWKATDLRISGTTNTVPTAGTITFYKANTDGTASPTLVGVAGQTLTAAAAPATGSTFDARFRNAAQAGATNPGTIVAVLKSTAGAVLGTSAPFAVSNG